MKDVMAMVAESAKSFATCNLVSKARLKGSAIFANGHSYLSYPPNVLIAISLREA
jgi:hypothetical protein